MTIQHGKITFHVNKISIRRKPRKLLINFKFPGFFVYTFAANMELKEKIQLVATGLFFKYGIKSVSMDDISKEAGISKKTLYQAFENKKKLINEIIHEFITLNEAALSGKLSEADNAIEEVVIIAKHVLEFLRNLSPALIYDLQKFYTSIWNLAIPKHMEFIRKTINHNLKRGQEEGLYIEDLRSDIIVPLYMRMSYSFADDDLFPLDKFPRAELFMTFISYHVRGIVTKKGREYFNNIEL